MRKADAPAPGWFPDPLNRTSLRWWDGGDWTDHRRAMPSTAEVTSYALEQQELSAAGSAAVGGFIPASRAAFDQIDTGQIIEEVRAATRDELDRAAGELTRHADAAVRSFSPLISSYTNKAFRWLRVALALAVIVLVAWFVFRVFLDATLFDWIGDRIDNFTDNLNDDGNGLGAISSSG
jgi:hypothetical protein